MIEPDHCDKKLVGGGSGPTKLGPPQSKSQPALRALQANFAMAYLFIWHHSTHKRTRLTLPAQDSVQQRNSICHLLSDSSGTTSRLSFCVPLNITSDDFRRMRSS